MENLKPKIPVIGSGSVAWQRYKLGQELKRREVETAKLQAQLDDLLTVLGRKGLESNGARLRKEIDAVAAARDAVESSRLTSADQQAEVQRRGWDAEARAAEAQRIVAELGQRREQVNAQLASVVASLQGYAGRQDAQAAEARVHIDGERTRLATELAKLDQDLVEARRSADQSAREVASLMSEWKGAAQEGGEAVSRAGEAERDALVDLGRRVLEMEPEIDPELSNRARAAQAELDTLAEARRQLEAEREALPQDVSISADLAALSVTGVAFLGFLFGLGGFEPALLFAALIGGALAWAVPGDRWWWAPVRLVVSTAGFFWTGSALSGAFHRLELPLGALVALGLLLLGTLVLVVVAWRRPLSVSRIASPVAALLVLGATWGVFNSHRGRVALAEAERAAEAERIAQIRADPASTVAAIRTAVSGGEVFSAGRHVDDLAEALGPRDPRVIEARAELDRLRSRLSARSARRRRQERAQRNQSRARMERCFDLCAARRSRGICAGVADCNPRLSRVLSQCESECGDRPAVYRGF